MIKEIIGVLIVLLLVGVFFWAISGFVNDAIFGEYMKQVLEDCDNRFGDGNYSLFKGEGFERHCQHYEIPKQRITLSKDCYENGLKVECEK